MNMHLWLVVALVVTGIGAVIDWRTGHIPNWLTVGALFLAPLGHAVFGFKAFGFRGAGLAFGYSVLGALCCVVIPLLLYIKGATGGGDLKLFCAVGAMCRSYLGLESLLVAFVVAAALIPIRMAMQGKLRKTLQNTVKIVANPLKSDNERQQVPEAEMTWVRFGPAIFAGVAITALLEWSEL